MGIKISTQTAQIGINTHNAKLDISQPKGELSIKQIPPKVKIKQEHAKVIIDQYQCFAEAGLKNNTDLSKDILEFAKKRTVEAIQRICSDGDRMAMIEKSMPEAISELSKKNSIEEKEFGFTMIPKSRPKIDFKGGISIDWELGGAEIDYKVSKPKVDYTPGKVEIYMEKWANITINYVDEKR